MNRLRGIVYSGKDKKEKKKKERKKRLYVMNKYDINEAEGMFSIKLNPIL